MKDVYFKLCTLKRQDHLLDQQIGSQQFGITHGSWTKTQLDLARFQGNDRFIALNLFQFDTL